LSKIIRLNQSQSRRANSIATAVLKRLCP